MIAVGLDWISRRQGWALCEVSGSNEARLDTYRIDTEFNWTDVGIVIIDVPIGLPENAEEGCALRDCDRGARRWIGDAQSSSIFPCPFEGELKEWQLRHSQAIKQRQGHFRGLLPAIDSARRLVESAPSNVLIVESHPELVFAALSGRPLPAFCKKSLLLGMLLRFKLLNEIGIRLIHQQFANLGRAKTDDFVDAAAMAAVGWSWLGKPTGRVVIRRADGSPEPYQSGGDRMMALPTDYLDSRSQPVLTSDEVVELLKTVV